MRPISLILLLLVTASCAAQEPGSGRLLLSNLDYPPAQVEAVVTANPDCDARGEGYVATMQFLVPPDGTRFIDAPPGADVCWRRDRDPPWRGWNRAHLAPGWTIDSQL